MEQPSSPSIWDWTQAAGAEGGHDPGRGRGVESEDCGWTSTPTIPTGPVAGGGASSMSA